MSVDDADNENASAVETPERDGRLDTCHSDPYTAPTRRGQNCGAHPHTQVEN
jgi:hypothetical protein